MLNNTFFIKKNMTTFSLLKKKISGVCITRDLNYIYIRHFLVKKHICIFVHDTYTQDFKNDDDSMDSQKISNVRITFFYSSFLEKHTLQQFGLKKRITIW